ncbi:MAG: integration host factor subunit beta [SAR324 cluster bacterium]|nr:integration host factor subunit beta [SAR324 cluster bacterium]MBF0352512.1 integration host factor subunit beta [SAR324 cluster bacterium]
MNKSQLIEKLAEKNNNNLQLADKAVRIFFDNIKESLNSGERVEIRGFGSFILKKYEGYVGRNPKTGTKVEVSPKKLPVFRTGKDLKQRVNEVRGPIKD